MELDVTQATLFCGMGGHSRTAFYYSSHFLITKIYIIYAEKNTPEFEAKIRDIKRDLAKKVGEGDHKILLSYITVNKRNFLGMYNNIIRLMLQERDTQILTDITAGHKIISYAMFYAYTFARRHFKHNSKLIYLHWNSNKPITIPSIDILPLGEKKEAFMQFIHNYYEKCIPDKEIKDISKTIDETNASFYENVSLVEFLNNKYSSTTSYRYRKNLRNYGYLDNEDNITLKGMMYLNSIIKKEI